VAEALYVSGHDVVALDTSEHRVDRISRHVSRAAVGDGREIETLEKIGAQDARGGVVSTGDDITASILATLALRDLGVPDIYAKVVSREHARIMEKIGVTETICPERESGLRLATRLASTKILNYVRLGAGFSIQEMAVPTEWIGRSLRQLALPRRHRVSVIAVHDVLTDAMIPVPDPDAPLKDSDTLLVAGSEDDLERVSKVD
jgi:trk system potassium uptake protein TrkA